MKEIYLDNAATTQIDREVYDAMRPFFMEKYGNASSLHSFGEEAKDAIENARKQVAIHLNSKPEEIYFTSSATESNNWVVKSISKAIRDKSPEKNEIIVSKIEHPSILESAVTMENEGFKVHYLNVDSEGIIKLGELQSLLNKKTALVSIMYANNETGTIEPISEIAKISKKNKAYFHTDAAQALNYLNCDVKKLGVDMLTISSHKIYGPKGVGALYIKTDIPVKPFMTGGAHEQNLRAGTYNTPLIVGFGKACELIINQRKLNYKKVQDLRDFFLLQIKKRIPNIQVNGSLKHRIPNNLNISFKGLEGESLLLALDIEGISVSTGSACATGELKPSHVLLALGLSELRAHSSIRFSLGKFNTKEEIIKTFAILEKVASRLRKLAKNIKA